MITKEQLDNAGKEVGDLLLRAKQGLAACISEGAQQSFSNASAQQKQQIIEEVVAIYNSAIIKLQNPYAPVDRQQQVIESIIELSTFLQDEGNKEIDLVKALKPHFKHLEKEIVVLKSLKGTPDDISCVEGALQDKDLRKEFKILLLNLKFAPKDKKLTSLGETEIPQISFANYMHLEGKSIKVGSKAMPLYQYMYENKLCDEHGLLHALGLFSYRLEKSGGERKTYNTLLTYTLSKAGEDKVFEEYINPRFLDSGNFHKYCDFLIKNHNEFAVFDRLVYEVIDAVKQVQETASKVGANDIAKKNAAAIIKTSEIFINTLMQKGWMYKDNFKEAYDKKLIDLTQITKYAELGYITKEIILVKVKFDADSTKEIPLFEYLSENDVLYKSIYSNERYADYMDRIEGDDVIKYRDNDIHTKLLQLNKNITAINADGSDPDSIQKQCKAEIAKVVKLVQSGIAKDIAQKRESGTVLDRFKKFKVDQDEDKHIKNVLTQVLGNLPLSDFKKLSKNIDADFLKVIIKEQIPIGKEQLHPVLALDAEIFAKDAAALAQDLKDAEALVQGLKAANALIKDLKDANASPEGLKDANAPPEDLKDANAPPEDLKDRELFANQLKKREALVKKLKAKQKLLTTSGVAIKAMHVNAKGQKISKDSDKALSLLGYMSKHKSQHERFKAFLFNGIYTVEEIAGLEIPSKDLVALLGEKDITDDQCDKIQAILVKRIELNMDTIQTICDLQAFGQNLSVKSPILKKVKEIHEACLTELNKKECMKDGIINNAYNAMVKALKEASYATWYTTSRFKGTTEVEKDEAFAEEYGMTKALFTMKYLAGNDFDTVAKDVDGNKKAMKYLGTKQKEFSGTMVQYLLDPLWGMFARLFHNWGVKGLEGTFKELITEEIITKAKKAINALSSEEKGLIHVAAEQQAVPVAPAPTNVGASK